MSSILEVMRKRTLTLIAIFALALVSLTACQPKEEAAEEPATEAPAQ